MATYVSQKTPKTLTALASGWTQVAKEYKQEESDISSWEQTLTGLQQAAKAQQQLAQQQASYDISQAYANYKQQQLQIAQASKLGTGFKEQLVEDLKSAYSGAYTQAKVTEAQNLQKVAEQYASNLQSAETAYGEMGTQLARYQELLNEYASQYGKSALGATYRDVDWSNLGDYKTSGLYDYVNGQYQLNEKGQELYKQLLLSDIAYETGELDTEGKPQYASTSFTRWLQEQYPDEALGFTSQIADVFRTGFGTKAGTTAYDREQAGETTRNIRINEAIEKAKTVGNFYTNENIKNKNWKTVTSILSKDLKNIFGTDVKITRYQPGWNAAWVEFSKKDIESLPDDVQNALKNTLGDNYHYNSDGKLAFVLGDDEQFLNYYSRRLNIHKTVSGFMTYDEFFKALQDANVYDTNPEQSLVKEKSSV